jgi:ceramide glucosyltransferase
MPEWILPALLILGTISLALVTVFHAVTLLTLRRTRRAAEGPLPALSVLKPVCGHDDGLYENLTAIARQDYPDFEVLVGAADPSDPALEVACRVQRENPGVRMRVVVSDRSLGLNRKVANVAGLAARARHEWLLVSDSNVRPDPDHLRSMAGELRDARVGLVSSVLAGTGERTTGALLENAHLDSFIVSTVCMGDRLGHPCVIGKSMLLRRADLARVGG